MRTPAILIDTECYPNYWLLRMISRDRQWRAHVDLHEGQTLTPEQIAYVKAVFRDYLTIGFNSLRYDNWMICAALNNCTPAMLKVLNDRIIVDKVKPWELGLPEWRPADHIDVMETAPGNASLKKYGGILHSKTMQDLPYDPSTSLTDEQKRNVFDYCGNDIDVLLADLVDALEPQIRQRERLGEKWGIDLRSKSDAQVAEAVIKRRAEMKIGRRIFKPDVDWNMTFRCKVPAFVQFQSPVLQQVVSTLRAAEFRLGANGAVEMPAFLEDLKIPIGAGVYRLGIGGLHSSETRAVHVSDEHYVLHDNDVASYYPTLIRNSGGHPSAIGPVFQEIYGEIVEERLADKALAKKLKGEGDTTSERYEDAHMGDAGGKIMINGTFGKTLEAHGCLFAPEMGINTTIPGQLSLLMLIEWCEMYGIPVVSANTDGIVTKCPRQLVDTLRQIIRHWEATTGLTMESVEYRGIYSRDVNAYVAIKADGEVKRKGAYAKAGLVEKKQPDLEICADAVADYLATGADIATTIIGCRDIRKFVTVRQVKGGAVKLWGEGPSKKAKATEKAERLTRMGWVRQDRSFWQHPEIFESRRTQEAYEMSFAPQRREPIGKVIRTYYSTQAPGTIVYETNGNTVADSEGMRPCMRLPDEFPTDIDYAKYISVAMEMLADLGVTIA